MMPPGEIPKARVLSPDDAALRAGWPLLEFLVAIGADEFSLRFLYVGNGKKACDRLVESLAFASLGERTRECTVSYGRQPNPRPVMVWRLDPGSIAALRSVMPEGIMGSSERTSAWGEDLCVYRGGELILGTVTHERWASLRLSDAEWQRWEGQGAGPPDQC